MSYRETVIQRYNLDWFDLNHYDFDANLSQWVSLIGSRISWLRVISTSVYENPLSGVKYIPSEYFQTIKELDDKNMEGFQDGYFWLIYGDSPIRNLRFNDYLTVHEKVDTKLKELHEKRGKDPLDFREPDDPTIFDHSHVFIDLHAANDILIDNFKSWLLDIRKKKGIKERVKKYSQLDADKWREYKVLAYMDLSLWEKYQDINITNADKGILLFPGLDGIDVVERVRNTVKKYSQELLSDHSWRSLTRQVGMEAEHNWNKGIEAAQKNKKSIPD